MKLGALQSSANPEEVAMSVKGAITAILPLLILVGKNYGIMPAEINTIVDAIINLITLVTGVISSCMITFGLLRKIYFKVK